MNEKKQNQHNGQKVAEKNFDVAGYQSNDPTEKGLAMTHEQVSDTLTEGTVEAKIDEVDENGEVKSHNGKDISK